MMKRNVTREDGMARCSTQIGLALVLLLSPGQAGEKKAPDLGIINAAGKQEKMRIWHFTGGTRRLSWLGPPGVGGKPGGPECLQFREERSTSYVDGILTLIPLASLKAIDYDPDKKSVTATALAATGKDEILKGTTRYEGFNRITIEGEADLGDLGSAEVKLQGGVATGLRGLRFSSPQPSAEVKGRAATIVADDKEKTTHGAAGLTPLYFANGAYRTQPELMFKKTVKIDLDKIAKLRRLPPADKKQTALEFEVTLADGAQHNLTLLTKVDGKGQLVGLVGQVAVGYKLFPLHTIAELRFEAGKKE
jgi:hypothetical protein